MMISNFIYRQKQKINYHFARTKTKKLIAEINRFDSRVLISQYSYRIPTLNLDLPQKSFDYVFQRFDLLIGNAQKLNGNYSVKSDKLYFTWKIFNVHISSVSELFIINEIFVAQCYNFQFPKDYDKVVVIDIGQNVGLASLYFADKGCVDVVYGFEPFKSTFDKAIFNFSLNENLSKKIVSSNFGLGNGTKALNLPYNDTNSGLNSTVGTSQRELEVEASEQVEIRDTYEELDRILQNHRGQPVIIKIDTEGAEFEIIERLEIENIWNSVRLLIIEWHFKDPNPIEEYLKSQGFTLISITLNIYSGLIYASR